MTVSDLLVCGCLLGAGVVVGCGGDDSSSESPWAGQTFLLEIPEQSWAEPRGVGAEFGAFVPQFVLAVEGGSADAFDVRIGTARGGEQDRCNPTTRVSAVAEYPQVQIGPSPVDLHVMHDVEPIQVTATIFDLTLTNVLPDGDEPTDEGELIGTMDLRELYAMFTQLGPGRSADTVCTALASFGSECAPCPSDGANYCLTVRALYFGARAVPMQLETIAADDLDPNCFE